MREDVTSGRKRAPRIPFGQRPEPGGREAAYGARDGVERGRRLFQKREEVGEDGVVHGRIVFRSPGGLRTAGCRVSNSYMSDESPFDPDSSQDCIEQEDPDASSRVAPHGVALSVLWWFEEEAPRSDD